MAYIQKQNVESIHIRVLTTMHVRNCYFSVRLTHQNLVLERERICEDHRAPSLLRLFHSLGFA